MSITLLKKILNVCLNDVKSSLHLKNTKNSNLEHFRQIEWARVVTEVAKISIFGYIQTKVSKGPDFWRKK